MQHHLDRNFFLSNTQELANVFGTMLNLVVKNLDCLRWIIRYVVAYDVERQREETPSNILHINQFYKVFKGKFLKSREEQVGTGSLSGDEAFDIRQHCQ